MEEKETQLYMIDNEIRTLKANEIECRIGTISSKGCSLLLYKDARVDMKILDETYGVGNWQRTHEVINDNLFCTIEVWNDKIKQWVKKQDVGTESYTEKEKGEASDSFKRAGFNVGIGRELYTTPFVWITPKKDMKPYNTKEIVVDEKGVVSWQTTEKEFYPYKQDGKGSYAYTTKTVFKVEDIDYNENKEINKLIIVDHKGNIRFELMPLDEQQKALLEMPIMEAQKDRIKDMFKGKEEELKTILVDLNKSKLSDLTSGEAIKILGD